MTVEQRYFMLGAVLCTMYPIDKNTRMVRIHLGDAVNEIMSLGRSSVLMEDAAPLNAHIQLKKVIVGKAAWMVGYSEDSNTVYVREVWEEF